MGKIKLGFVVSLLALLASATVASAASPIQLSSYRSTLVGSVVAPNGDVNPYGLTVVPTTVGNLVAGDVLVADFNSSTTPGAGTTILEVNPTTGTSSVFFQGSATNGVVGPVGIAINPVNGIVWLGDYGPANSAGTYSGAASDVVAVKPTGTVLATFNNTTTGTTDFNGVWGQAVSDVNGQVAFYWTNAGDGTTGTGGGQVWRLNPNPTGTKNGQPLNATYTLIASGLDSSPAGTTAATTVGPQGMAYDPANGNLYVTEDSSNQMVAIPGAATATSATTTKPILAGTPLNSPQNVVVDPTSGNLVVANGAGNNDLIELSTTGQVLSTLNVDSTAPAGALFGLAAIVVNNQLALYYGNADSNNLYLLSAPAAAATPTPTATPTATPLVPVPTTGAGIGGSPGGPLLLLVGGLAIAAGVVTMGVFRSRRRADSQR